MDAFRSRKQNLTCISFRQSKGAKNHRDDGRTGDVTPKYIKEEEEKRN